jgi:hypothetical protein
MKAKLLRKLEAEGACVRTSHGIFVFPQAPRTGPCVRFEVARPRMVSLADRLAALPKWPQGSGRGVPCSKPQGFGRYPMFPKDAFKQRYSVVRCA